MFWRRHICQTSAYNERQPDERTLRTRFAPRRKPCADTARLSVLSCSWSSRSPLSATFVMLSLIIPTVSSICCWIAAVLELPADGPGAAPPAAEPLRGRYGSYGSDLCAQRRRTSGGQYGLRRREHGRGGTNMTRACDSGAKRGRQRRARWRPATWVLTVTRLSGRWTSGAGPARRSLETVVEECKS